ncbi:MAG TPA: hypothetical protein VNA20_01965 [Frankiaceae bacterium]|nr:hypothetical protein [Frankiaceae bacterium]
MRTLVRLVAVAVTTLGLTPALQGHAWACSCVMHPQPTEEQLYREAAQTVSHIFVGRVDRVRRTGDEMSGTDHYTVTVTETLKGPVVTQRRMTTPANGGLCGVQLQLKKPILAFDDGSGRLGGCDPVTTQEDVPRRAAIVRAALAGPQMPRTGGGLPSVALVVVTAAAYAARRRRATA